MRNEITHHHDGHGLNESIQITCDERDPKAGGASHVYHLCTPVDVTRGGAHPGEQRVGHVKFQHGPRDEPGSSRGITDAALLAIVLDRYEGFQSGPFVCEENERVQKCLLEALHWMKQLADERTLRRVLGKNEK